MNGVVHEFRDEGSSPLSRGIHTAERLADSVGGIIPALAGNTSSDGPMSSKVTDHPRSRGEYQLPADQHHLGNRIIPALAGNTISRYTRWPWSKDHPRSRGEYDWLALRDQGVWEIIPALAGNTPPPRSTNSLRRDHPRSRGEYSGAWRVSNGKVGSSPLSRGIRVSRYAVGLFSRIIPALAGNTGRAMNPFT